MEDLRIMALNKQQKDEMVDLLIQCGGIPNLVNQFDLMGIHVYENGTIQDVLDEEYEDESHKEITLPQLKDMVVLKRNDVADKTHKCDTTNSDYFVASDNTVYFFDDEKTNAWKKSNYDLSDLKPIGSAMKEYLDPRNGYKLIEAPESEALEPHASEWIEVPEGAHTLTIGIEQRVFWKDNFGWNIDGFNSKEWRENDGFDKYMEHYKNTVRILWQRAQYPEELPFIDDEPSLQVQHETPENKVRIVNAIESAYAAKSINDQYAEIEQVRQKTVQDTLLERQKEYGCFEDVAFLTQGLIDFLSKHTNYDEMPKPHKEALHMIASKVARLTLGNFNHKDSWHDIGGYAKLIENLISEDSK